MRAWNPDQLAAAAAAIDRARAGAPTVLLIDGEPGTGKTSYLDDLEDLASGFRVLASEGAETGDRAPLRMLAELGLDVGDADAQVLSGVLAAQRLRELIDAASGPAHADAVLLRIDDLQWVDPESIEALTGVLRRASGDRLLVAMGTRPWDGTAHAGLFRWVSGRDRAVRITLAGMSRESARAMSHAAHPSMSNATADALWEHTSGNPLYLSRLLAEYTAEDLVHMRVLPAPAQFASNLGARLARLPDQCLMLMQASAVLGAGWQSLQEIGDLARIAHPVEAAQQLVEEGLLQSRQTDAGLSVRASHALVRAAVYQQTALPRRQELHARAAAIVVAPAAVLEHRIAAAAQYDEDLAQDLEAAAAELHAQRSFRLAGQYLRSASTLTRRPQDRQRRWLESLIEVLLDREYEPVLSEMPEVARASDVGRRTLVQARIAMQQRRPHDAIELLEPVLLAQPPIDTDPATRYRAEVVLAWCQLTAGAPSSDIARSMARMAPLEPKDAAFGGWAMLTAGQLATRIQGSLAMLNVGLADMPAHPAAVSWPQSGRLAWRGSIRANMGDVEGAIADLSEVTQRLQAGILDFGAGSFHAFLARSWWLVGDWARARVNFRLAAEVSGDSLHPMTAAMSPAIEIGEGDLGGADQGIARALAILEPSPWVEAWDQLTVTRIMRLHADGSPEQRGAGHALVREGVHGVADHDLGKNAVWLLHAALVCIWAGELEDARICVSLMDQMTLGTAWLEPVRTWLRGLIAQAAGEQSEARALLRAAAADTRIAFPLYRAHILADHAAAQQLAGAAAEAHAARREAARIYGGLGARGYAARIEEADAAPTRVPRQRPALGMTEREQDVLTLVAEGLSYAQIARDLFITQSTVGYHLSNIYAKADVSSRHQLTEQVRRDPASFGIAAHR